MKVNSNQFSFSKKTNTFAAFDSDFGQRGIAPQFTMVSAKTGREVQFSKTLTERNDDDEIVAFHFRSIDPRITAKVVIFND